MTSLQQWNDLTRPEQRILIKLVGGGSLRHNNATETAVLRLRGLVDDDGLTTAGLEVFMAAFKSQQETRRAELVA